MKPVFWLPMAVVALSSCVAEPTFPDDRSSVPAAAPVDYRTVADDLLKYHPVEPRAWAEVNGDVAPAQGEPK